MKSCSYQRERDGLDNRLPHKVGAFLAATEQVLNQFRQLSTYTSSDGDAIAHEAMFQRQCMLAFYDMVTLVGTLRLDYVSFSAKLTGESHSAFPPAHDDLPIPFTNSETFPPHDSFQRIGVVDASSTLLCSSGNSMDPPLCLSPSFYSDSFALCDGTMLRSGAGSGCSGFEGFGALPTPQSQYSTRRSPNFSQPEPLCIFPSFIRTHAADPHAESGVPRVWLP